MAYFSGLGISLSFVFGCIILGLIAEVYYVLYWKKRSKKREQKEEEYTNITNEIPYTFCWKHPISLFKTNAHHQEQNNVPSTNVLEKDLEGFYGEDSVDLELMRLHNLAGPPRFLFPIKEESKEDLESEDGRSNTSRKGSRTRSLSDFDNSVVFTPMSSPPIKIIRPLDAYSNSGFNPLFDSISNQSSPPPRFKFLRDAEEKLMKRLMEETEKKRVQDLDGSFLSFLGKNRKKDMLQQLPIYCSTNSQVLPLA